MASPTLDELHDAKKTALAVVNLFRHCGGLAEAFDTAIALKDEQDRLGKAVDAAKKALTTTVKKQEEAEAAVQALTQQQQAMGQQLADELAAKRQAQREGLEAEAETLWASLTVEHRAVQEAVKALEAQQGHQQALIADLDAQIAQRQQTLVNVQAQLQAMLVGGAA